MVMVLLLALDSLMITVTSRITFFHVLSGPNLLVYVYL